MGAESIKQQGACDFGRKGRPVVPGKGGLPPPGEVHTGRVRGRRGQPPRENGTLSKQGHAMDSAANRFKQLPVLNREQIDGIEYRLTEADGTDAVAKILREDLNVDPDHIDFLIAESKKLGLDPAQKLRQLFHQGLLYDLTHPGTMTAVFVPEEEIQGIAKEAPLSIAAPEQAMSGVKHRASETSTIIKALSDAVQLLTTKGRDPCQASFFDLGTGTGKPPLLAMSKRGSETPGYNGGSLVFPFTKAVGVDYWQTPLEVALKNIIAQGEELGVIEGQEFQFGAEKPDGKGGQRRELVVDLDQGRSLTLRFQSAASFREYNGLNVVFMYNPFGRDIVQEVEANIRRYAGATILLYNKPLHCDVFTEENGWRCETRQDSADPDKQIYIYSRGFGEPQTNPKPGNDGVNNDGPRPPA